jgi:hypothetical protein
MEPKVIIYHDDFDRRGDELIRAYFKDSSQFTGLEEAARLYEKTSNPDGKKIVLVLNALYYRELGHREKDKEKASDLLQKAFLSMGEVSGKDSIETKTIELEYLKKQLEASIPKKPSQDIFLRMAEIHKSLGNKEMYHTNMTLYYIYSLTDLPPFDNKISDYCNLMVSHAKDSGNTEVYFKAKGLFHQIKCSMEPEPKLAIHELEEALQMIKQTQDKFGEREVEAKLNVVKAMTIADKKKRQQMLKKAATTYGELGNERELASIAKMLLPVPVGVTLILQLVDQALKNHQKLNRRIQELIKFPPGPYALFHHHGHLIERINDTKQIIERLGKNRKELSDLSIRENAIRPIRVRHGKPFSKKLHKLMQRRHELTGQMKMDMESLYIFGNLLLDQWAYVIAYLIGHNNPDKFSFHSLYERMSSKKDKGTLLEVWNQHRKDIYWLYYQLRSYRNIFIEHVRRPWQRGNTMSTYGDDFNLFIPTPPGWLDDSDIEKRLKDIFHLAPKPLKEAPDDYWEKKNLHRVLEITFMNIDGIEQKADREKIWNVWKEVGGSTPSYDNVAFRLMRFVSSSVITMIDIIAKSPENINLGKGGRRKSK